MATAAQLREIRRKAGIGEFAKTRKKRVKRATIDFSAVRVSTLAPFSKFENEQHNRWSIRAQNAD